MPPATPPALLADGLNATEQAHFGALNVSLLSQYPSMTDGTAPTVDQRTPAAGANLVNFLRGQRGLEGFITNDADQAVPGARARARRHRQRPADLRAGAVRLYGDPGYARVQVGATRGRIPMLYVPGNDGMLHAFYAGTSAADPLGGKEAWAVIPSTVLPKLYKLADNNYKDNHAVLRRRHARRSATSTTAARSWRTILVAGLNNGGKGYYALDVTDPLAPKGLWEFKWSSARLLLAAGDTPIGQRRATPRTATSARPTASR